ncbi:MAG: glycosyltransferase family 2 protein [Chroococcus sp. CMT-3BRIN-NPC107]|jgi:GT2 family glycosyltransferase|nr:glycosyltransferase family 2 protein [Chroococcus sp. CMT-3BRIN-NPC107]
MDNTEATYNTLCLPKESVYIIIPVHNRKNITLSCLYNLSKSGDLERYHLIVIDDGSTDGTTEAIKDLYPEVIVLSGDGNLWWTGAIKKGMEYAINRGAKYLIWLNDDCIPDTATLSLIVNFLKINPETIVGASCYTPESNEPVESGFKGRNRLKASPEEVIFVDGLSGYCVGISSAIVNKIGLPNADHFPHYFGDVIYILKATHAKYKVCILGSAKVILPGENNAIHSFSNYLSQMSSIKLPQLFWNKKSQYYLPAQFFYHIEKYNLLFGIPLFLVKTAWYLVQFILIKYTIIKRQ